MVCGLTYESQFWHRSLAEEALSNFRNLKLPQMIYIAGPLGQQTFQSNISCKISARETLHFLFQDIHKSHTISAVCFTHGHNILQEAVLKCVFMNRSINTSDLLPARACHGYYFRFTAFQRESSIDCSPPGTLLV